MQTRVLSLSLAAAVVAAAACGSSSDTAAPPVSKIVKFSATMTPAGEPGTLVGSPTGNGTFTATLDTSTNVFTWSGTFTGLTSNATLGHIHGPFPNGTNTSAGALLNFDPAVTAGASFVGLKSATSGSVSGTVTLNSSLTLTSTVNGDSLRKLLFAGAAYVNIHTTNNGGGEIRGQITKQ